MAEAHFLSGLAPHQVQTCGIPLKWSKPKQSLQKLGQGVENEMCVGQKKVPKMGCLVNGNMVSKTCGPWWFILTHTQMGNPWKDGN